MIKIPYWMINALSPSINSVMAGSLASGPPRPRTMLPICGITKTIKPKKAAIVITMSTVGYVMALLIFLRILAFFSCCMARRLRISSRIPAASPARTMLIKTVLKVSGCFSSASASAIPPSTSRSRSPVTIWRALLLVWSCSEPMARSSGTPADTMALSWRVNITKSSLLTLLPPKRAKLARFGLTSSALIGRRP